MDPAPRRGRPRTEGADEKLLAAARDLLLERGVDRFSMDEVAATAGVAKTTLYRRWPTKDHLIVMVIAQMQDDVPLRYSGDVRADLTSYLNAIVQGLERARHAGRPAGSGDTSAGLVAEVAVAVARHADIAAAVHAVFARRNALVHALLQEAMDQGELLPGTDLEALFDQLAGALYYRLLVTGQPLDGAYVDRLLETALKAVAR